MKTIQNLLGEFLSRKQNKVNPSRPNPGRREKIKLDFYFNTLLWGFKSFSDGVKGLHKTF